MSVALLFVGEAKMAGERNGEEKEEEEEEEEETWASTRVADTARLDKKHFHHTERKKNHTVITSQQTGANKQPQDGKKRRPSPLSSSLLSLSLSLSLCVCVWP